MPTCADHARHRRGERLGVGFPSRCDAFVVTPEINKFHLEFANRGDGFEHLRLEMRGGVPAFLSACCCVDAKDHSTAVGIDAREERLEMSAAGGGGCGCHLSRSKKMADRHSCRSGRPLLLIRSVRNDVDGKAACLGPKIEDYVLEVVELRVQHVLMTDYVLLLVVEDIDLAPQRLDFLGKRLEFDARGVTA